MADDHVRVTYNEVHKLIAKASERIQTDFKPDILIAIGERTVATFELNI
jgi:hypoxanthine phosphoribosyltransferase